ncbi:hypothetical protein QGP82_06590 [Leptothoe sp. LEGE 181152]|nr:hypothetical protein [Leptothoe sp. LEGE 181152]
MSHMTSKAKATVLFSLSLTGLLMSSLPVLGQSRPDPRGREDSNVDMPLLDGAQCTHTSSRSQYDRLRTGSSIVSVNRRPYESQFYMSIRATYRAAITCLTDSRIFPLLSLQMGVPDDDVAKETLATVNVYQSGNVVYSYDNIIPGSLINTPLSLGNGEDFAIEIVCHRAGSSGQNSSCNLHFLEAKLYGATNNTIHSSPSTGSPAPGGYVINTGEPQTNPTASDSNRPEGHTPPNNPSSVIDQTNDVLNGVEDAVDTVNDIFDLF